MLHNFPNMIHYLLFIIASLYSLGLLLKWHSQCLWLSYPNYNQVVFVARWIHLNNMARERPKHLLIATILHVNTSWKKSYDTRNSSMIQINSRTNSITSLSSTINERNLGIHTCVGRIKLPSLSLGKPFVDAVHSPRTLPAGLNTINCRGGITDQWRHRERLSNTLTCGHMYLAFVLLQWWSVFVFVCTPPWAPHWRRPVLRVRMPYKEVVGVAWRVTSPRRSISPDTDRDFFTLFKNVRWQMSSNVQTFPTK